MTDQPYPVRPSFDLTGRVAVVTGGSRGLGRAIALGFADAGARVVVASRKADACEAVVEEITAAGGAALAVPTNVGRPEQLTALVEATVDGFGGIDVLVNNAANPLGGPLGDLTPEAFDAAFRANVQGPVLLATAALPHLQSSPAPSIINVITVGAFAGAEYLGLYTATKAAMWNLTRTMAKEWAPHVRVNAIAPGPFDTDMMGPTLAQPEFHRRIVASTLAKRIADPAEIVGAALFLASDASSFVTGTCVTVDGGLMA
ncbi:MAG: glucose 1-dehydrogenase [Acidobacteria bacterium]|nr:glucose 1-dehydrogenase [Acidobacteriota bacterium]